MAKPAGRLRVSGDGRHEKQYRRQPYNYDFKLRVINYYATASISATIARFFTSTDVIPSGSKRKLVASGSSSTLWQQRLQAINAVVIAASLPRCHSLSKLQL